MIAGLPISVINTVDMACAAHTCYVNLPLWWMRTNVCCISSYLQTMAYNGTNPTIAIQMALAGEIGGE